MGFIKDMKADALGKEAAQALEEGAYCFTPKLNTPSTQHGLTGNIATWAHMIQAVESSGWVLAHWTVALDNKGRPEAYPLFKRR